MLMSYLRNLSIIYPHTHVTQMSRYIVYSVRYYPRLVLERITRGYGGPPVYMESGVQLSWQLQKSFSTVSSLVHHTPSPKPVLASFDGAKGTGTRIWSPMSQFVPTF